MCSGCEGYVDSTSINTTYSSKENVANLKAGQLCPEYHLRLFYSVNRMSSPSEFTPGAHKARDVVNRTLFGFDDVFGTGVLTKRQQQARTAVLKMVDTIGDYETIESRFRQFFKHFDNYYFYGMLRQHIKIHWLPFQNPNFSDPTRGLHGSASRNVKRPFPHHSIHMYKFPKPFISGNPGYDLVAREMRMLGTLLHESIHAWLMIYVCQGHICTANLLNGCGLTGHGVCWQIVASRVQRDIQSWHEKFKLVLVINPIDSRKSHQSEQELKAIKSHQCNTDLKDLRPLVNYQNPRYLFTLQDGRALYRTERMGIAEMNQNHGFDCVKEEHDDVWGLEGSAATTGEAEVPKYHDSEDEEDGETSNNEDNSEDEQCWSDEEV